VPLIVASDSDTPVPLTLRVIYESIIQNGNRATLIKRVACYRFIAERSQQALCLILKFHQKLLVYQVILKVCRTAGMFLMAVSWYNFQVARLKKSNKIQQCADIYLLLNYPTYFGRPLRPSSGIRKTVVAVSGTDRTIWGANFFKRDQIRTQV